MEYKPKNYTEKKNSFTPEQERFLDLEVMEMNKDALAEEDYKKIYSENFIKKKKKKFYRLKINIK